jgi:serine/threonine protein kinase
MPSEVPFGRYALLTKIASGGMAELFLARQRGPQGFEKLVAIKRILPARSGDARFVELFLAEARLAARLSHPSIAQIYDLGIEDGSYFLAMEYISGENLGTLESRTREQGFRLPIPLVIKIAIDVCEGLYYAHHLTDPLGRPLRVVHCDISPQNILVGYDGSVKIVDFGIARADADTRRQGEVRGKAAYMAPEQLLGLPLDHTSDMFSLGVVLYELLTARRLFARGDEGQTIEALRQQPVPPLRAFVPEIPPALDAAVLRTLARERDRRYPDARALQRDLEALLAQRGGVPSSAALSEFMSVLFRETLAKRVFVENTMTAVIPLGTQLGPAPTIVESPPEFVEPTVPVNPRTAGLVGGIGVALGLLVGVVATVWFSRHPATPSVVAATADLGPLVEPLPVQESPAESSGGTPETAVERPVEPMAIRRAGRMHRAFKYGFVSLNTEPWSNVRIDGRPVGPTPIRELKLPAGPHKLSFENVALKLRVTVHLEVGENKHVQHRFMLQKRGSSWTIARHLQL